MWTSWEISISFHAITVDRGRRAHVFLNLKTLNVKTHRDLKKKKGPCVYFTAVMKIFSHLYWATKATQMPIIMTEGDGILYSAKSTVMEFSIHKKHIELYSKVDFNL